MPLLNTRNTGAAAELERSRAAEIPLRLVNREVKTADDASLRLPAAGMSSVPHLPAIRGTGDARNSAPESLGVATRTRGLFSPADALRTVCGNRTCSGGWTPPWRSRRYPFFEGKWACSQNCLLAMVRQAIAREIGDGVLDAVDGDAAQHRHRIPLGLVLLGQGWITHPQLRKALEMQRLKGSGRIGHWLVSECGLRDEWITRGLSVQWNCPVLTTEGFSPETMARVFPRTFIEEYGILPVRIAARRILYVGFQDHLDASSAFAVEQMSGLRTECGVISEAKYRKARELVLGCRPIELKRVSVGDRDSLARSIERVVDQRKPIASRLVRLHRYYWLRLWQESQGSIRAARQVPAPGEATDFLFTIGE